MKSIVTLTVASVALCFSFSAHAKGLHILSGSGFSAPGAFDPNVNDIKPQLGDIVFDTAHNVFLGYGGSLPWIQFGAPTFKAPTVRPYSFTGSPLGYTPPANVVYIKVRLVGGGGGGASTILGGAYSGVAGDDTTFQDSTAGFTVTAGKGLGGGTNGGAGGTNSLGGLTTVNLTYGGQAGQSGLQTSGYNPGGVGGGNGGGLGGSSSNGYNADSNSGGGGGGGANGVNYSGGGGGAGGVVEFILTPVGAHSYQVYVGNGGAGGSSGTGNYGGQGGTGTIAITEYYQ